MYCCERNYAILRNCSKHANDWFWVLHSLTCLTPWFISSSGTVRKEIIIFWMNSTFCYIFFRRPRLHSLGPPPIISQIRRFLTKLFRNGEKRSQNWENLHKAIYVNFLSPTQGLFKWNFICWITQKLGHFFKEFLASLLVDTTKTPHSCLLIFNLKQRIPP